jgi:Carboxyltransferase domain, subdomain C and D
MDHLPPYNIYPLGDAALIIDFGNIIDETINKLVHSLFYQLQNDPIPGMIEAIPAYSSLTIHYDVLFIRNNLKKQTTAFQWIAESLKKYISIENIETGDPQLRYPLVMTMNTQQISITLLHKTIFLMRR